jgi:hypothetical protein
MNAHDSSVYCACNSDSRAIGITATTLSDSPCLVFVLLRQTHVPPKDDEVYAHAGLRAADESKGATVHDSTWSVVTQVARPCEWVRIGKGQIKSRVSERPSQEIKCRREGRGSLADVRPTSLRGHPHNPLPIRIAVVG